MNNKISISILCGSIFIYCLFKWAGEYDLKNNADRLCMPYQSLIYDKRSRGIMVVCQAEQGYIVRTSL